MCSSDLEKIRRKLPAIKPQWDVRTVAEHLYRAYHSSGLTLDDFEGPRYQRIKKPMPTKYLMLICGTRGPGATVKQRQSSALSGDS